MIQCACSFREIYWRLDRENNIILLCKACRRQEYTLTPSVGHKLVKSKQNQTQQHWMNLICSKSKWVNSTIVQVFYDKLLKKKGVYNQSFHSVLSVTSPI